MPLEGPNATRRSVGREAGSVSEQADADPEASLLPLLARGEDEDFHSPGRPVAVQRPLFSARTSGDGVPGAGEVTGASGAANPRRLLLFVATTAAAVALCVAGQRSFWARPHWLGEAGLAGVEELFGVGDRIKVVQTQRGHRERLAWKAPLVLSSDFSFSGPVIEVYTEQEGQEILGFGGAFTEASASVFAKLPDDLQKSVISQYFGSEGLGYTLGRVHINSCDFSLAHYTFDDTPKDYRLKQFDHNLTHDAKLLIPFIKLAQQEIEATAQDVTVRMASCEQSGPSEWQRYKAIWGVHGKDTVVFQGIAGRFLSVNPDGVIKANHLKAAPSTVFNLVRHKDHTMSLRGVNGRFLHLGADGSTRASSMHPSTRLVQMNNADGTISLQAPGGLLLSAGPGHGLRLLASPWSPPAWMKTSGKMDGSGTPCLKAEAHAPWAKYISEWVTAYKNIGVPIWSITVQNEPTNNAGWESCKLSAEEEGDFLVSNLGPTMKADHPDVGVFIFDDSKHMLAEYVNGIMQRPGAAEYVTGAAFHWYSGDFFDRVTGLHKQHPGLVLLASEATYERRMWKEGKTQPYPDWRFGEGYAHDIIGDLNAGASGWIDWNLLLDTNGGPNHVGNVCDAAIVVDTVKLTVEVHPQYHYVAHFSKFISPGSKHLRTRIVPSGSSYKPSQPPGPYGTCTGADGLETTAARRPDGQLAIVVLNCGLGGVDFKLKIGGVAAKANAPPRSITTYIVPALG